MKSIARGFASLLGLATIALLTAPTLGQDATLDAARKDMAETLGAGSIQLNLLPEAFFATTWAQNRAWVIDQKATIPPKYRALIGLAVSSQIPCAYCIYADTSDAKVFGATDEEIREAILFAGMTRLWSAIYNGNRVDFEKFKAEIDAGAAVMSDALKHQSPN